MRGSIAKWTAQGDALLLGRMTYEIFAAHWPHVPNDDPVGHVLNLVVINQYRRAGDIRYGSFVVDERGGVEALWTEGKERR
jgi:dihydrofolate reductase